MRKNKSLLLIALLVAISYPSSSSAQSQEKIKSIYARSEIQSALKRFDDRKPQILKLWRKLALTNAPSGHEDDRAAIVMQELRALGYDQVYRDAAGNVVSAPLAANAKSVVFVAHLDTVVQPGVKVTIAEDKNETGKTTWTGPGVGDDTCGVVALLEVAEALREVKYKPSTPLVFVFSVNEEGGGTSEGAGGFLKENKDRLAAFISVDGSPIDALGAVADNGVGAYGLEPIFTGPGVHTIESYKMPSTTLAVALAIENLYKMEIPREPLEKMSWMNIGTIKAGTVRNAMAKEARFTVDLRSNDAETGNRLEAEAKAIIDKAARDAGVSVQIPVDKKRHRDPVFLKTPEQKNLIDTLWESYRVVGIQPQRGKIGASDFVNALQQGVPGAGIGVTNIRRMHSPEEEAEVDPLFLGIKAVLLAAVELTAN